MKKDLGTISIKPGIVDSLFPIYNRYDLSTTTNPAASTFMLST